jgi:hypothetical protein
LSLIKAKIKGNSTCFVESYNGLYIGDRIFQNDSVYLVLSTEEPEIRGQCCFLNDPNSSKPVIVHQVHHG